MATSTKSPIEGAQDAPPKRIGRPPYAPGMTRSGRISMRTYPDVEAKARRVGTEAVERAIMRIKED